MNHMLPTLSLDQRIATVDGPGLDFGLELGLLQPLRSPPTAMQLQQDIHGISDCIKPDMSLQPTKAERKRPIAFLDLSAELRNEIYHYALTAEHPVLVRYQDSVKAPSSKLRKLGHRFSSPSIALLRTCRTVRHEATPLFFGNNTLSLPFLGRRLDAFTDHVSVYIKHIRSIRLRLRDMDSTIVAALTALKQFPSLKSLEIVNGPIHRLPGQMAQLFLPLVKSLAAARGKFQIPEGKVLQTIDLDVIFLARDSLGGSPLAEPRYMAYVRKNIETLFAGKEIPILDYSG